MKSNATAPVRALGSTSAARRAVHVCAVSAYLAATWVILVATRRLRIHPIEFARKALRRVLRGLRGGPAPAGTPSTPVPEPAPSASLHAESVRDEKPAGGRDSVPFALSEWIELFRCPRCRDRLARDGEDLACPAGHRFPVIRDIPRFVESDAYVRSFSREWNTHDTTQLDSHHQTSITEDTLRTKTGLTPSDVAGKLVLDAGVGSGRFAEVLARWGARVVGVDLSLAVEAARRNLATESSVCIAQADIGHLPFAPATFDLIVSIGVLHHTPDTRRSFEALVPLLKPGGTIAIWVYPNEASYATRAVWIPYTSRIPEDAFYDWCRWLIHLSHRHAGSRALGFLWDAFPYSRQGLGLEWDVLDTFDGYSPRYHGIHSPDEVMGWFRSAGLAEVREAGPVHTSVRGARSAVSATSHSSRPRAG